MFEYLLSPALERQVRLQENFSVSWRARSLARQPHCMKAVQFVAEYPPHDQLVTLLVIQNTGLHEIIQQLLPSYMICGF